MASIYSPFKYFNIKKNMKTLFILTMLVLNIYNVAWPLTAKYLSFGIMIEVSTVTPDTLMTPAVSIGRIRSDGW